mmetsp:Transcript_4340/g.9923  ORF Transcript_4340/g.9923 Transcript_4340/m.9923 type:complete len:81 (+) Transcript_4340:370-612(+)
MQDRQGDPQPNPTNPSTKLLPHACLSPKSRGLLLSPRPTPNHALQHSADQHRHRHQARQQPHSEYGVSDSSLSEQPQRHQ